MYSDEDLDSAVAGGVVSAEAAAAFRAHVAGLRHTPAVDEEQRAVVDQFAILAGNDDDTECIEQSIEIALRGHGGDRPLPGLRLDAMRVLRLRAAVLMLSAPGSTPSDVARTVGYGSLDAMGRAFRDAALPAPSVVQAAVKYPE